MEVPQSRYDECCYYYDVKQNNGVSSAGIFNSDIESGVVILYDKTNLPYFTEWKMVGKSDYVLGLELGNCTPDGRDILGKESKLSFLEPEKSKTVKIMFKFFDNEFDFKGAF